VGQAKQFNLNTAPGVIGQGASGQETFIVGVGEYGQDDGFAPGKIVLFAVLHNLPSFAETYFFVLLIVVD
jgi:hypothetical protein